MTNGRFSEIIIWTKGLPKWQQAIIRDILEGVAFDSMKINAFTDIALDDSNLADDILDGFVYFILAIAKIGSF